MDVTGLIQTISIAALPILFAITLHEAAHGYAARHFGDTTAWVAGRISLNPLRHVDPVGTLLVPALILAIISSRRPLENRAFISTSVIATDRLLRGP